MKRVVLPMYCWSPLSQVSWDTAFPHKHYPVLEIGQFKASLELSVLYFFELIMFSVSVIFYLASYSVRQCEFYDKYIMLLNQCWLRTQSGQIWACWVVPSQLAKWCICSSLSFRVVMLCSSKGTHSSKFKQFTAALWRCWLFLELMLTTNVHPPPALYIKMWKIIWRSKSSFTGVYPVIKSSSIVIVVHVRNTWYYSLKRLKSRLQKKRYWKSAFLPLTFPMFAHLTETPSRVWFIIHRI